MKTNNHNNNEGHEEIAKEAEKDVLLACQDLPAVNQVEYLHPYKGVENNSVKNAFISRQVSLYIVIKFISFEGKTPLLLKDKKLDASNSNLVDDQADDLSPHNLCHYWLTLLDRGHF